MKIAFKLALAVLFTASISLTSQAASRTLSLKSFTGIELTSSFNVVLKQGSKQKVTVEGPSEIINKMNTSVSDGTWKIYSKYKQNGGGWSKETVTVYVTIPKLTYVALRGSGDINGSSFNTGNLKIALTGSGNLKLGANSSGKVSAHIAGSGNMKLNGSAKSMTAKVTGSGNIQAKEMKVSSATTRVTGSGNISLHCTSSLSAHVMGSGNVYYKGNPSLDKHKTGSGRITKI